MKSDLIRKIVIGTFLSVPAVSSVISTIHLIDLFNLGNPTWLSILLAVTFELGSIASLLAISVIEKIKTGAIWFIFFILAGLQILGNVYYSYSFTSDQIISNPTFLTNFMDLFSFITGDEIRDVKIFLACIIGIPIPLIALFFLKSNIDYLRPKTGGVVAEVTDNESPVEEKPKSEPKIEPMNESQDSYIPPANIQPPPKPLYEVKDIAPDETSDTIKEVIKNDPIVSAKEDDKMNDQTVEIPMQLTQSHQRMSSPETSMLQESSRKRTRHPMISSRRFS